MIYLTTGGNGAGKTLFTLKDVREQQLKENRPVYFHGFTANQILLDWGWKEFDPKKWQDLPDGSVCVFDECQNEFPAKIQGELPDYINAVAQYRRKRGFDFWMITPHPSMIHLNIRRLIESPSWHRHMKRTFGADMVSELRFNHAEMKCEQPNAGKSGQVSMRAYPKEVYEWYKSASLHTGKRKLPKQLWIFLTCMLVIPVLIYFVWQHFLNMGKVAEPVAKPGAAMQASAGGPGGSAPVSRFMSLGEYLESRTPRIADLPHTAPAYDEVTKPVTAPYPAACVQDAKRCECYTQQGTLLRTSGEVCKQIVKYGYFMDWDDGRSKREAPQPVQQKQQQQQADYRSPQPYQKAPELVGFEERMAARNATVVSSLKR
ncbi:zonular occludens toxin domain-containing protein [Comamonas sp.]|uniref:zonular occludens toxin domain-containing protein n=1 Tax=Comamonas sp. TaxID=34028 RepID=UPI003D0E13B9